MQTTQPDFRAPALLHDTPSGLPQQEDLLLGLDPTPPSGSLLSALIIAQDNRGQVQMGSHCGHATLSVAKDRNTQKPHSV